VSILTKVFLIVVAILSIALSTLSIAANSMGQSWKKSAEDWKAAALTAQSAERVAVVQAKLTHEQDLDKVRKLSADVQKLQTDILQIRQQLDARTVELGQAQSQNSALSSSIKGLSEQLDLINAQFNREQEFNRKISTRNAELERRNIDLNDRVKELTTALAMANTQVRALQQQLGGEPQPYRPGPGAAAPAPSGPPAVVEAFKPSVQTPPAVTAPIRGTITSVRGNVAGISVGSADGVAPGMRFVIYRGSGPGSQYVGTLEITRVEANESAGTVSRATTEIQRGDQATDEASLAMRP
jgi:hypothetical protein